MLSDALHTHRKPWLHLGHFQHVTPSSLCCLTSFRCIAVFCLMLLATGDADVSVFAIFGHAAAGVPPATDFDIQIERVGLRFLCCRPGLRGSGGASSNDNMMGDKVTKSAVIVK